MNGISVTHSPFTDITKYLHCCAHGWLRCRARAFRYHCIEKKSSNNIPTGNFRILPEKSDWDWSGSTADVDGCEGSRWGLKPAGFSDWRQPISALTGRVRGRLGPSPARHWALNAALIGMNVNDKAKACFGILLISQSATRINQGLEIIIQMMILSVVIIKKINDRGRSFGVVSTERQQQLKAVQHLWQ